MNSYSFTALTRYEIRNNRVVKRILTVLLLSAFILYLFLTGGVKELIICGISIVSILSIFMLRNASKKPHKMFSLLFRKSNSEKCYDVLPIDFNVNDKIFEITLNKAEYYNKKTWNKKYVFNLSDVYYVQYFDEDNTLFLFYEAGTLINESEDIKEKGKELGKAMLMFYLPEEDKENILSFLEGNGYTIHYTTREIEEKKKEKIAEKEEIETKNSTDKAEPNTNNEDNSIIVESVKNNNLQSDVID